MAPNGAAPANSGVFAYPSIPQTVAEPGRYTFRFGPLRAEFNYPRKPSGVAFDYPCDFPGKFQPTGTITVATDADGQRYLEVGFDVAGQFHASAPILIVY